MKDGTYLIGRRASGGRGRSLVIDHPTVSQLHAELVVLNGTYHLTDLDSRNGTWRIGPGGPERLDSAYVQPDEPLRFGAAEYSLEQLFGAQGDPGD